MNRQKFAHELYEISQHIDVYEKSLSYWENELLLKKNRVSRRIFQSEEEIQKAVNEVLTELNNHKEEFDTLVQRFIKLDFQ